MPFSSRCCRQAIAILDGAGKSVSGDLGQIQLHNTGNSDIKQLTILAAAAITVGAVAPAAAADLPARRPAYSKAPAIVEAAYDWSGFYIGINGGGATSRINWNADASETKAAMMRRAERSVDRSATAGRCLLPGIQRGSARQLGRFHWQQCQPAIPGQTKTRIDAFGLFTGQIGYAWDRTLFYVKGGAAVTDNIHGDFDAPAARRDRYYERNPLGRYGRRRLRICRVRMVDRLRYDHLFMGNHDVNSATGFLIADHIKEDVDLFTARVNYRFGGPVVARYEPSGPSKAFFLDLSKPRPVGRGFLLM